MKKIFGFLVVLALLGGAFYLVQAQDSQRKLPVLTSAQYASANSTDIYIMLVGWDKCAPCSRAEVQLFIPLLDKYKNNKKIHVVKVDALEKDNSVDQTIAKRFQVTTSPTMLIVRNWQVLWRRDEGFRSAEEKNAIMNEIISMVNSL